MNQIEPITPTKSIVASTLDAAQSESVMKLRSSGASYRDIRGYLKANKITEFTNQQLAVFFKEYLVTKNDSEIRAQLNNEQRYRRFEQYRRSDFVANIIEKTLQEVDDNDENLELDKKSAAIVNLSKVLLETITKDANVIETKQSNSMVQVNIGDAMKQIENNKSDLKKEMLSSPGYDVKIVEAEPKEDLLQKEINEADRKVARDQQIKDNGHYDILSGQEDLRKPQENPSDHDRNPQ